MAVLDWAQRGDLTTDVATKLVPVLSTGVRDPTLGFTEAFFHTAAQLQQEVAATGFADVHVVGIEGPAWTIVDPAGNDAGARFDAIPRRVRPSVSSGARHGDTANTTTAGSRCGAPLNSLPGQVVR
jgi:hypothetical protein